VRKATAARLVVLVGICAAGGLALVSQSNPKLGNAIDLAWDIVLGLAVVAFVWFSFQQRRNRKEGVLPSDTAATPTPRPRVSKDSLRDLLIAFVILFVGFGTLVASFLQATRESTVLQPGAPLIVFGLGLLAFGIAVGIALPRIFRVATRAARALLADVASHKGGAV
jgi:hypothetical protein